MNVRLRLIRECNYHNVLLKLQIIFSSTLFTSPRRLCPASALHNIEVKFCINEFSVLLLFIKNIYIFARQKKKEKNIREMNSLYDHTHIVLFFQLKTEKSLTFI